MTAHQVGPYVAPVSTNDGTSAPVPHYELRVAGRLGDRWSAWFDGMTLTAADDGTTSIRGPIVDQAALHGVLQKLRDLGIPLISLAPVPAQPRPDLDPNQEQH
jgi:hypothetical protein